MTHTTTLEALMPRLASHDGALPVTDAAGAVIGQVSPRGVVNALASAERDADAQDADTT